MTLASATRRRRHATESPRQRTATSRHQRGAEPRRPLPNPSRPFLGQPRPLPAGYKLPFLAPFCYSPRGISPHAEKSRTLRDLIKRADPATLARCTARLVTLIDADAARDFLGPDIVLVPVPPRFPYDPRDLPSVPEAIARALHTAAFGKVVWPALRRTRAIPKSQWCRPGSRPEFLEHYNSLTLASSVEPVDHDLSPLRVPPSGAPLPGVPQRARRFLLVDDFVTRGRTLLAAAAVLYQAIPRAQLRAFALVRTEGLRPDIAAIVAPTIGTIRHLGGDAFRSP